jgi:hypothetical protein
LIAPPVQNMDVSDWREQAAAAEMETRVDTAASTDPRLPDPGRSDPELEAFRRRLEGLL